MTKWYKFDDGDVSECKMEDDEEMKSQCFGGDYMGEVRIAGSLTSDRKLFVCELDVEYLFCAVQVFDQMLKRMSYRRQKRWWNAYMLFYTRLDVQENILVNSIKQLSICKNYHTICSTCAIFGMY